MYCVSFFFLISRRQPSSPRTHTPCPYTTLFRPLTSCLTRETTRLWHLLRLARLFAFAACWLLGEGLRTWLFTGFPWNLLGTVWAFSAAPLQPAALGGIWLLSLLTVLAAGAPAEIGRAHV